MQIYKRIISLLLSASLVLSAAPMVYAVESPEAEPVVTESEETAPNWEETPEEAPEEIPEEVPADAEVPSEESAQPEQEPEEQEPQPEAEEAALPAVPGMPEGYVLSAQELSRKAALAEHDVPGTLAKLTAGKDYVTDQVILLADSEDYARLAAAAYGGELTRYQSGVATITLSGLTVCEAVALAADLETNLPAVDPNYILSRPAAQTSSAPYAPDAAAQGIAIPEEETWYTWIHELMDNPDPLLLYPMHFDPDTGEWQNYHNHHEILNTYAAWGVTTGNPKIVVALVSSGVYNRDGEISHLIHRDYLGYGAYSYDVPDGTISAHLIAGAMNNGKYGAGIAPDVTIASYNYINGSTQNTADTVSLVQQAAWDGVDIIYTDLYATYYLASYEAAVQNAISRGITVISPCGSSQNSNTTWYPAAFPGVIGVAPTDDGNNRVSGYGPHVDVCAPGYVNFPYLEGYGIFPYIPEVQAAAALVTGAAALYMSKVGHVSPAEMEKVLKGACNKSPSPEMGAGVIDLAKMFRGETAAPEISLYDYLGVASSASAQEASDMIGGGIIRPENIVVSTASVKTISANGYITITQPKSNDEILIYTTNGKNPSVKNGEVVNGILYTGPIPASSLGLGKVTLKAASISALGVVSKTSSVKLNIAPGSVVESVAVTAPAAMNAGSSVTLSASVFPSTANQSVVWSLPGNAMGAKIDMKTGKLTTAAGVTGTITVRACAAADTSVWTDVKITLRNGVPVSSIILNEKAVTLRSYSEKTGQTFSLVPTFVSSTGILSGVSCTYTSSSTKVVSVSASGKITAIAPGTATVTCKALDGSNKTATCKITVLAGVDSLSLSGQASIAPGASASYPLTSSPAKLKNVSTVWSISGAPSGVTVDAKKGTVKVAAYVPINSSFTLKVQVNDGFTTKTASLPIRVQNKATKVTVRQDRNSFFTWICQTDNKSFDNLKSATISSTPATAKKYSDHSIYNSNKLQLIATLHGVGVSTAANNVLWVSSNPAIATVDANGLVTAKAAGKVKITCTANDGSKKSSSFNLTVETPASQVSVTNPDGYYYINYGKSVNNVAVFGSAYGTPTNKKVIWSFTLEECWLDANDEYQSIDHTEQAKREKTVSISSSGKLSVKAGAAKYQQHPGSTLRVSVEAQPASELFFGSWSNYSYTIRPAASKLITSTGTVTLGTNNSARCGLTVVGTGLEDTYLDFTCKSSNPDVASVYSIARMDDGTYSIVIVKGHKTGTAKITITTKDPAKTKTTLTVKAV